MRDVLRSCQRCKLVGTIYLLAALAVSITKKEGIRTTGIDIGINVRNDNGDSVRYVCTQNEKHNRTESN